jgi:ribonuclease HII
MSASSCFNNCSPDFSIEADFLSKGYRYIAGVDEAGRGSLAGPLSIGLVIYDSSLFFNIPDEITSCINDSKKLSHRQRLKALSCIDNYAVEKCNLFVPHPVIDEFNINQATRIGIEKLLGMTSLCPDLIIMDGNFKFNLPVPFVSVVKGDKRSVSISSASIIAKVRRDAVMDHLDSRFPGYGFASNKGYGTKKHIEAIEKCGISPLHRISYEPAKSMRF